MSEEAQFKRIVERWHALHDAGQTVCIEELCSEQGEACTDALKSRLRAYADAFLSPKTARISVTVANTSEEDELISDDPQASKSSAPNSAANSTDHEAYATQAEGDPFRTQAHQASDSELGSDSYKDLVHVFCVSEFENFKFIDRGGLGEVHMATQAHNGREVAIKFIRPDKQNDEKQEQFEIESKITAKLEHPGVVPVYGFGVSTEGRPFYIMRMINGKTMRASIKDFHTRLSRDHGRMNHGEHAVEFRELLNRFVSVCQTIAYAHSVGILHRDLKPQNIMFGNYGETLVVDWGLARPYERTAKQRDSSGLPTLIRETKDKKFAEGIVGTPNYMSPEQADGDAYVGPKTDIYSLGTCLYEIITGDLAVDGNSLQTVLSRVRRNDITHPSKKNAQIPPALSAIAMKAMRADPTERYESAAELAEDVERFLADEPVSAFKEPWSVRVQRWIREHTTASQIIAGTLLAMIVAATAISFSKIQHYRNLEEITKSSMRNELSSQRTRLEDSFATLRRDVLFLAEISDVVGIARAGSQRSSLDEPISPEIVREAEETFIAFASRQDSYMQARIIDKNGNEALRVERSKPGAPVGVNQRLANKADRGYFKDTRDLPEGMEVRISEININRDLGRRDFNFPVVRASVPIHETAEDGSKGEFLGIVVINMHFNALKKDIARKAEQGNKHIFMVNQQGQFLFHPIQEAGFLFERGIELRASDIYNELSNFLTADDLRPNYGVNDNLQRCSADAVLLIRPNVDLPFESKEQFEAMHKTLAASLSQAETKHGVRAKVSSKIDRETQGLDLESCHAVIRDVPKEILDELIVELRESSDNMFRFHRIPQLPINQDHIVYSQKVYFDEEDPSRYLTLVMAESVSQLTELLSPEPEHERL